MTDYVVTYDFKSNDSGQWKAFAERAEAEGLLYVFQGTSDLFRLPNTTLWGPYDKIDDVKAAFDRALSAAKKDVGKKITLEKRFISSIDDWSVRSDKKKAPESKWTKTSKFGTCREHQKNDPFFDY